ncbi:MAG: TetR/AcrR family transcriptional regulator [Kiloniellaceae bacterium]
MPQHKQFDENEVLERAMQAFWNRGYEATSVQDLVDCTGINRGSIYGTYGDKHALFLAALRRYDEKIRRELLARLENRYTPREAIRQVFLSFSAHASESGDNPGCFLTNTALELAAHDDDAREIVAQGQKEVEDFFARMIRAGQARDQIPARIKPREAARGLLATLQGLVVLTRSRPNQALLRAIVNDAMERLA